MVPCIAATPRGSGAKSEARNRGRVPLWVNMENTRIRWRPKDATHSLPTVHHWDIEISNDSVARGPEQKSPLE